MKKKKIQNINFLLLTFIVLGICNTATAMKNEVVEIYNQKSERQILIVKDKSIEDLKNDITKINKTRLAIYKQENQSNIFPKIATATSAAFCAKNFSTKKFIPSILALGTSSLWWTMRNKNNKKEKDSLKTNLLNLQISLSKKIGIFISKTSEKKEINPWLYEENEKRNSSHLTLKYLFVYKKRKTNNSIKNTNNSIKNTIEKELKILNQIKKSMGEDEDLSSHKEGLTKFLCLAEKKFAEKHKKKQQ